MLNPLEDDETQTKTVARLMRDVFISKDKVELQQQMHMFKVHQDADLVQAIQETQKQGRIPLFIRTPRCMLQKDDVFSRVANILSLDEEGMQVIDLRRMFYENQGGKDAELKILQKTEITKQIRTALVRSQMLVLNFDDTDMTMDDRAKATPSKTSRTEKS